MEGLRSPLVGRKKLFFFFCDVCCRRMEVKESKVLNETWICEISMVFWLTNRCFLNHLVFFAS